MVEHGNLLTVIGEIGYHMLSNNGRDAELSAKVPPVWFVRALDGAWECAADDGRDIILYALCTCAARGVPLALPAKRFPVIRFVASLAVPTHSDMVPHQRAIGPPFLPVQLISSANRRLAWDLIMLVFYI